MDTKDLIPELKISNAEGAIDTEKLKEDEELMYEVESYRKEICKHCRGKGYATHQYGTTLAADFAGDIELKSPQVIHIEYCRCDRGKQLEGVVTRLTKEAQLNILKKVYKNVIRNRSILVTRGRIIGILRGYYDTLRK